MKKFNASVDLNERVKIFADWFDSGGYKTIWSKDLLEDLKKAKYDVNGIVIRETITPLVNSAMLAYEGTQLHVPMITDKLMIEYETFLQKSLFFDQIIIDTQEDFDKIFEKNINKEKFLFRGVNEAKWRLYNSLQRHWITEKIYLNDIKYSDFVVALINNAKKQNNKVLTKYFQQNGIDVENDIAILSFLQHHGSPTPLLDWTGSFANALYFAINNINKSVGKESKEIDKYVSVYYLPEDHLSSGSLVDVIENALREEVAPKLIPSLRKNGEKEGITQTEMEKLLAGDRLLLTAKMLHQRRLTTFMSKTEKLFTYPLHYFSDHNEYDIKFSLNNSLNIVNQEGVFIWNSHPIKPIEHIGNELISEDKREQYRFSSCYNINKNLVSYIKQKLEERKIDSSYIYPDPNKLAKDSFNATKAQLPTKGHK